MRLTPETVCELLDEAANSHRIANFTWEQHCVLGARLHLLGDGERWAVATELLVYWPERDGFEGTLWTATSEAAVDHHWYPLQPTRIEYDSSMDAVGPLAFQVGDKELPVDWELSRKRESEHATSAELEALAAICESHRDRLLLDPASIPTHVHDLPLLTTIDDWTHPDIDRGERPSQLADWQRIAAILAGGRPAEFHPDGTPNANDWRLWFQRANA